MWKPGKCDAKQLKENRPHKEIAVKADCLRLGKDLFSVGAICHDKSPHASFSSSSMKSTAYRF